MFTFHHDLIDLRNALGYETRSGVCTLYSNMAINAFLVGDLETFHQRCASIKKRMADPAFFDLINRVRNTSVSDVEKSGTTEVDEIPELLDVMAFMDSGELYVNPFNYKPFFGKYLNQAHKAEISFFAQSAALEQRKGRVLAKSFIGIYTLEELKDYIKLLNKLAENAQQDFALNLGSENHDIGLCYSHATKSWQLFDVNQPDLLPLSVSSSNWEEQLVSQIRAAFADGSHILFRTEIWTTGLSASSFQKHITTFSDDSKFKQLHDIASHAHLVDGRHVSLAYLAAGHGDVEVLQGCIAAKDKDSGRYVIDLNDVTDREVTPLYIAAQNGFVEAVKLLIAAKDEAGKQYRVNLNRRCKFDETPVLIATYCNHAEILRCLIEAKDEDGTYRVDLNLAREGDVTPVSLAAECGHIEALKLLIEAKDEDGTYRVDLNLAREGDVTPVSLAAEKGHIEALKLLIEAKDKNGKFRVDLNKQDNHGISPMRIAAQNGNIEAFKLLLQAKDRVELNQQIDNGTTIVHMAASEGRVDVLKLLIEAKNKDGTNRADLNRPDIIGATPVFSAALKGHKDVVIELIKANVDISLAIINTVENYRLDVQNYEPGVLERLNKYINNKEDSVKVRLEPKDIALIMGHNEIANLFERKTVVDQIQKSIKALESSMLCVGEKKIPSAYRLHEVLNKAVKVYKDKVYDCTPGELQELNRVFQRSCQEVYITIEEGGFAVEPGYGDAINNVLTVIINALNYLLSLPVRLLTWDSDYLMFNRKDYSSHEIRKVFGELGKISHNAEVQCVLAQESTV